MTQVNAPAYTAAMDTARLLGGNFKMVRDRKRALALNLVKASVVEDFALAEAIKDAKSKMNWARLASDEQSQMNVLFTAVRLIDGAWKALPPEKQKAFLAGEIVFSTLAKEIKDAEKAALEAEAKASEAAEEAEANREEPVGEDGKPLPEAPAPGRAEYWTDVVRDMLGALPSVDMTPELALALMELRAKIEELAGVPAQDQAQAA